MALDTAFFTTKYFVISAVAAGLILGGAAGVYYVADSGGPTFINSACNTPALLGTKLASIPTIVNESGGDRRTETYTLNATAYAGGRLDLCASVGEVIVEPSTGPTVELVWVIHNGTNAAVEKTQVMAEMRNVDGRLVIAAWQSTAGRTTGLLSSESADARLTLRVPATGGYDVTVRTHIGDIHVSEVIADKLGLRTDVGDIVVRAVDLQGNATATTNVGKAIFSLASVQTGTIRLVTDVGDAEVELPQRADVGYDATAKTDVGEVTLRIGATEDAETHKDVPGGSAKARSQGFAGKPTQVIVSASADVGNARIVAS